MLIRHWKWIAALAIVAAVAALVVSFLLPSIYEGSALAVFVCVFGAFVVEYWRQERPVTQPPEGA